MVYFIAFKIMIDIGSVHLQNDSILILILKKSFCILVTIVWVVLAVWLSLHMPSLSYNFAQQAGWSSGAPRAKLRAT